MKIHMGAGSRFVEVETTDACFGLAVLREFVVSLYDHLEEPRLESTGVGFTAERRDCHEPSGSDHAGPRTGRPVVRDGDR